MHKIIKGQIGVQIPGIISSDMLKKIGKGLGVSEKLQNWDPTKGAFKPEPLTKDKQIKTETASKLFGNAGINAANAKFGDAFSLGTSVLNTINTSLVGNESTGKTAENLNGIANTGASIASSFNPLGGLANSAGKTIGNLIGGTKDRVSGSGSAAVSAISTGLSFAGPAGMVIGAGLNLLNGIGGGRAMKLADQSGEFGSGFSGSQSYVHNTIDKYSNKKAGLFDFGFKSKANRKLREAQRQQGLILDIQDEDKKMDLNSAGEYITANNANLYAGYKPQLFLSRNGMKFPELDAARNLINSWSVKSDELQKFQLGGKMNLIPEGALHARKHNLEKVNPELEGQITSKGIPVVAQGEGGVIQQAEIEKEEVVFRKEFTDELERLYKLYQDDSSDDIAIEAGKLICYELLKNTDDRSGLIKSIE